MRSHPPFPPWWSLRAAALLIGLFAVAAYTVRSLDTHLWMDELLTMRLVAADSLTRLWHGIALGIDGNPPLYLTSAWLLAHATPAPIAAAAVLRFANLAVTATAIVVLYRISLRAASRLAAWIGGFLFVAMNDNLAVLAFDLRTYALYFMLSALAVLLQQRLIEHRRSRDVAWLALGYAALTLSHNFGIVYVVCIALAGVLGQVFALRSEGWRGVRPLVLATLPAVIIFGCWFPVFAQQSATGRPYLWITEPDLPQLLVVLFSSPMAMWVEIVELACLAAAAIGAVRTYGWSGCRAIVCAPERQFARMIALLALGISGFTLSVWIVSVLVFPIFVPRYFVPQLMVSFALHVAFCELVIRTVMRRVAFDATQATEWAAVGAPLLFGLTLLHGPAQGREACTDETNAYFEAGFVDGTLPVILESPHLFLPRTAYAAQPQAYRFALDWDVVLKYPQRSRGNATDFQIMQRLKTWQPLPSVMTTDEIVRSYAEFLVIEQSGQAWFENLRLTRDVSATQLARVSGGGGTCTLWKVSSVKTRS